jgi:hypothetical protein
MQLDQPACLFFLRHVLASMERNSLMTARGKCQMRRNEQMAIVRRKTLSSGDVTSGTRTYLASCSLA